MRSSLHKVIVRGEQCQFVGDAKLCKQRIDRRDLHAGASTAIAQIRGIDVILPARIEQWQRRKTIDDVLAGAWPGEPLEQLLQHQPGADDGFTAFKRSAQRAYLGRRGRLVAPKGQRPHAGVDQ